jgi:hypothetical protein
VLVVLPLEPPSVEPPLLLPELLDVVPELSPELLPLEPLELPPLLPLPPLDEGPEPEELLLPPELWSPPELLAPPLSTCPKPPPPAGELHPATQTPKASAARYVDVSILRIMTTPPTRASAN